MALKLKNSIINILMFLLDPTLVVDKRYSPSVNQYLLHVTRVSTGRLLYFLTFIELLLFFVSDYGKKDNIETWFTFRFSFAFFFFLSGFFICKTKDNKKVQIYSIFTFILVSAFFCLQSHLGFPLRVKWVFLVPTFIAITSCLSLLTSVVLVHMNLISALILWGHELNFRFVFSDYLFAIVICTIGRIVWGVLIKSKENEVENSQLREQRLSQYIDFLDAIKSLVPPVFVQELNRKIAFNTPPSIALDEIMQRKYNSVSVLYSDIRNYSERSDSKDFLEREVIPSSSAILDLSEKYLGIGRQIGDNVMLYYDFNDPEEGVLFSLFSAYKSIEIEHKRISSLGRNKQERHFVLTYGDAYVGNMGSIAHKDFSIAGKPINIAARIDELTKNIIFVELLNSEKTIICSESYYRECKKLAPFEFREIKLKEDSGLIIRSYPDETKIYLLILNEINRALINQLIELNVEENYGKENN